MAKDDLFDKKNIEGFIIFVLVVGVLILVKDGIVKSISALQSGNIIGAFVVGFIVYVLWFIFLRNK